ncbi:MAG: SpoIID/LytB domain-containing protein [Lachnospiraceae bacterium]|nr:SpoIID/LytB domain-containing protein [Lachnospiraceae bacterium]
MNKNRIVLKETNKRDAAGFLLFVFLLPYVCACLWGHVGVDKNALHQNKEQEETENVINYEVQADMGWGVWKIPLEEYLVYKLESVIPEEYEKEALKAQAVLLRTEVVQTLMEEGSERLCVSGDGMDKWYETDQSVTEELEIYQEAVEETDGLYLSYQGEPIQASYFKLSNGQTRDAGEMWESGKYPYLTSVDCIQDKASKDYSSVVSVSKVNYLYALKPYVEQGYSIEDIWEGMQLDVDDAGYVTNVSFVSGENMIGQIDGEAFRHLFSLPSASFEVNQEKAQIVFHVTGIGHGFGMSQYSANCMALNGETYDQILKKFFFGTELAKIE